jgi:hypothetical protein
VKIAVTSTVLFDVQDDRSVEQVRDHFLRSNQVAIGIPMVTLTGLHYVMLAIHDFNVSRANQ